MDCPVRTIVGLADRVRARIVRASGCFVKGENARGGASRVGRGWWVGLRRPPLLDRIGSDRDRWSPPVRPAQHHRFLAMSLHGASQGGSIVVLGDVSTPRDTPTPTETLLPPWAPRPQAAQTCKRSGRTGGIHQPRSLPIRSKRGGLQSPTSPPLRTLEAPPRAGYATPRKASAPHDPCGALGENVTAPHDPCGALGENVTRLHGSCGALGENVTRLHGSCGALGENATAPHDPCGAVGK
jgi:hypothetical protein